MTWNLNIGDPCVFGNLPNPSNVVNALNENSKSGKFNGYQPSYGMASKSFFKK